MRGVNPKNQRERLVHLIQRLESLDTDKQEAADELRDAFEGAKMLGYDTATLKVVLKLRKMTPDQRRQRRALESIYMAALGMLEGDPLTDEARRRLDGESAAATKPSPAGKRDSGTSESSEQSDATAAPDAAPAPAVPEQQPLIVKDPSEARREGEEAAAAGKRVYDNPYRAGDPCRAAWDEGWCAQQKSHGMETPAAYQRRSAKAPENDAKPAAGGKDTQNSPTDDSERKAS
jgi:uncharacterized protein (UPF0335 family)